MEKELPNRNIESAKNKIGVSKTLKSQIINNNATKAIKKFYENNQSLEILNILEGHKTTRKYENTIEIVYFFTGVFLAAVIFFVLKLFI